MRKLIFARRTRNSAATLFVFAISLFAAGSANAVLLGLIPDAIPDAKTRNTIDYYFTNGQDNTGGFTMEVRGLVTSVDDGVQINNVSGNCFGLGCYTLDASFDTSGVFQSGTIQLTGTSLTTFPSPANTGVLVDGILQNFGWGGNGPSGLFEFSFDLLTSDFRDIWGGINGGTIIDTRELAFGAGMVGACGTADQTDCYAGDWDATNLMTQEFSTAAPPGIFLSGNTTSDTFIPVPPAVWLFGSAIGLLGMLRRRRVVTEI